MDLKDFYKDKRVFVTGHTGFKGTWLLAILKHLGAKVHGYSLVPGEVSMFETIEADTLCSNTYHDIMDLDTLKKVLLEFQPEIVFHLAAQSLVYESYRQPLATFEVNSIGTAHVLEALRLLGKKCTAVMITTDKVYLNTGAGKPFVEEDALGGFDPYSASKAACEMVVNSYRHSFFHPAKYEEHEKSVTTARSGNVIGGGDWSEDRIVPDIFRAMAKKAPVELRNPSATRPWQHVLEPLAGYLVLAKHLHHSFEPLNQGVAWNFGPTDENHTVMELVQKIIDFYGSGSIQTGSTPQYYESSYLRLDSTKAQELLGWSPQLDFDQTVKLTVDWYQEFLLTPKSICDFTMRQVHEYFDSL